MDEKKMRTRYVNSLMRHSWIWTLLAVIALAGCTGSDGPVKPDGETPPLIAKDDSVSPNGTMSPEEAAALQAAAERNTEIAADRVVIPEPGSEGWEPSTDSLGELGKMLDASFAEIEDTRCEALITYIVPTGKRDDEILFDRMNIQVRADIRSAEVFNIDFAVPALLGVKNTAIGDGERRVMLIGGEWEELPRFADIKDRKMSKADLERFAKTFTQDMFALYFKGENVWEPLFTAYQNGVGGYESHVERKTVSRVNPVTLENTELTFIRVYASTDEGVPTQIEIRIDEKRMMPVTLRVVQQLEDGTEFKMMWTGSWAFTGGKYSAKEFVIPVSAQSLKKN